METYTTVAHPFVPDYVQRKAIRQHAKQWGHDPYEDAAVYEVVPNNCKEAIYGIAFAVGCHTLVRMRMTANGDFVSSRSVPLNSGQ